VRAFIVLTISNLVEGERYYYLSGADNHVWIPVVLVSIDSYRVEVKLDHPEKKNTFKLLTRSLIHEHELPIGATIWDLDNS
jgi:hypothetical protein